MSGRRDVAFERARAGGLQHRRERRVGQLGRLADVRDFCRRFDEPQGPDQVRGVFQSAPAVEAFLQLRVVVGAEAVAVEFDADAFTLQAFLRENFPQVVRGRGTFRVVPDADVFDDRGTARLLQVGPAGQQGDRLVVRGHDRTLKEHIAARVVAGQVVVALLREQQDRRQATVRQAAPRVVDTPVEFRAFEMQRHLSIADRDRRRSSAACPQPSGRYSRTPDRWSAARSFRRRPTTRAAS